MAAFQWAVVFMVSSFQESYKEVIILNKEIFLTFDMDWAIDEVLDDFYNLICGLDLCGTIHVTHKTKFLDKFRQDRERRLECGIHPNFNELLVGGGW